MEGDLCHHDLGDGLPFRPGMFDGAISISAVQWLCNAVRSCSPVVCEGQACCHHASSITCWPLHKLCVAMSQEGREGWTSCSLVSLHSLHSRICY